MTAIDDGLPAATRRVMDVHGCRFRQDGQSGRCAVHLCHYGKGGCNWAETAARAAREDVAETVQRLEDVADALAAELIALVAALTDVQKFLADDEIWHNDRIDARHIRDNLRVGLAAHLDLTNGSER